MTKFSDHHGASGRGLAAMAIDLVTTSSDGCRIWSRLVGRSSAPVVVLSSSLGTTSEMWAPQLESLVARFRVLRYHTRGHGGSDAPVGAYTLERLGRDVVEVLDAHEIERAHFCGISLGGMVGQWLGANASTRIDRLVLANTAAFTGPAAIWDERIELVLRHGIEAIADAVLARWFTPLFRECAPGVVDTLRAILLAISPVGYAGCCAAIRDMDLRASAARITPRTLLIAGSFDPSSTTELAGAMAAAPSFVMLDAAHLASVEQARAFNEAVVTFLS